eukprot:TRINITY_DN19615_c0_g1_i1.p1 TRINITY_DN19615_c0_g1~~TRINITY_DN19615_c0_g1_i1.p1  ORF type:complete len:133 (-),score=22.42 TRINITY_DN19615_c0_g1_i1:181-579(-)
MCTRSALPRALALGRQQRNKMMLVEPPKPFRRGLFVAGGAAAMGGAGSFGLLSDDQRSAEEQRQATSLTETQFQRQGRFEVICGCPCWSLQSGAQQPRSVIVQAEKQVPEAALRSGVIQKAEWPEVFQFAGR